jgi:DNA invertase Pin-like site-specific DNA recombinase
MRAIIYRRVSSEEQRRSGLGLSAQLQCCTELAKRLGATEIEVYTDSAVSGSTSIDSRIGLKEALAALKKGDALLVARRDRIARDMLVTLTVEQIVAKRKATLISAAGEGHDTDAVTNLIMKTMSDLFAQVERVTISSRTRNALKVKIANGERVGNIKYGYKLAEDGIRLIPNRREHIIIENVRRLRKRGLSLRAIAANLNDSNVRSRNGNPWRASQVRGLLNAEYGNKAKAVKQGRV